MQASIAHLATGGQFRARFEGSLDTPLANLATGATVQVVTILNIAEVYNQGRVKQPLRLVNCPDVWATTGHCGAVLSLGTTDCPDPERPEWAAPRLYINYPCPPYQTTPREIDHLLASEPQVWGICRDFIPVYDPVTTEAARLSYWAHRLRALILRREKPQDQPHPFRCKIKQC